MSNQLHRRLPSCCVWEDAYSSKGLDQTAEAAPICVMKAESSVLQASQGPAEVAQPSAPAASAATGRAGVPARLTPQPCGHG